MHNNTRIILLELNFEFDEEIDFGFSLDFFIPHLNCALEINGPSHFIYNDTKDLIESKTTEGKRVYFERLGLNVITMRYQNDDFSYVLKNKLL